jgi:hypothetical protein
LDERDYTSNLVATDRNWFYKNLDGSDQDPLVGDGQFNSLEYLAGRAWQIRTVAYLRGNSLVMRLKFRNTYRNAITANLHWSAVRLKVPAGFNRPTETYIHLTPPPDQQFTMGAWNGTADVTVTISGVPNHVAFGDLQLQAEMTAYPDILPARTSGSCPFSRTGGRSGRGYTCPLPGLPIFNLCLGPTFSTTRAIGPTARQALLRWKTT